MRRNLQQIVGPQPAESGTAEAVFMFLSLMELIGSVLLVFGFDQRGFDILILYLFPVGVCLGRLFDFVQVGIIAMRQASHHTFGNTIPVSL